MKLTAKIRVATESHQTDVSKLETREVTVEADSYDEAVRRVEEQTPAGWSRIWVRTG